MKKKLLLKKETDVLVDSRGETWDAECLAELVEADIKLKEGLRILEHYF